MRSNAMKTCAVGAMVVGGALSMTQTASAGLTWLESATAGVSSSYIAAVPSDGSDNIPLWANAAGLPVLGSESNAGNSVSYGNLGSAYITSVSNGSGFSAGYAYTGSTDGGFMTSGCRLFEVSGSESISITLTRPTNGYSQIEFARWDTTSNSWDYFLTYTLDSGSTPYTYSTVLSAGRYSLTFTAQTNVGPTNAYTGEFISFVPAPGALALLGAAGLAGSRRRR